MDSIILYEKNLADTRARKADVIGQFASDIGRFRELKARAPQGSRRASDARVAEAAGAAFAGGEFLDQLEVAPAPPARTPSAPGARPAR